MPDLPLLSPYLLHLEPYNVLGCNRKQYAEFRFTIYWSDLPPAPPNSSNWGDKVTDFVFLAFLSFSTHFRGFECIGG